MRGVYSATIDIAGLTQAKTLMYLTAPSSKCIEVLSAEVGNGSNETNEQLACGFYLVTSLGTPSGTSVTPAKMEQGDAASGVTVVANVTASEPTYSSTVLQGYKGFASLAGYQYAPTPEERFVIAPSATWGLRNLTAPTSLNATVVVTFREIG